MVPGQAFADVLDGWLTGASGLTDTRLRTSASPLRGGIATQPFIWYEPRRSPATPGQRSAVLRNTLPSAPAATRHSTPTPAPPHAPSVAPALPTRPVRHLTIGQRQALDALVALGARLDDAFTARDLRSAFRTLARRYHPDRHPALDGRDAARLAAHFTRAREAHDQLRTVADVIH